MDDKQKIDELTKTVQSLVNTVRDLEQRVQAADRVTQAQAATSVATPRKIKYDAIEVNDLVINGSIRMGQGDVAMHADYQGWWWGQETLAAIIGGAKGVAIEHNGTFTQNP